MQEHFDYGKNPEKTKGGDLIRSYECDPMTAAAEFLLAKEKYKAITGREQKRDDDVLYYQIRMAFPPGELDPEAALDIGYELGMRWTKGRHAFFVVSHADRPHPHIHIYYNSTTLDYTHKYRDFWRSGRALRKLADRVCLEHNLSVIQNPKLHSQGKFKHYGEWLGDRRKPSFKAQIREAIDAVLAQHPEDLIAFFSILESAGVEVIHGRGGVISFMVPGQERPARWRQSTLGDGYGPEDVEAILRGEAPARPVGSSGAAPRQKVNLIIDIQKRLAQGKGPGYERWAKLYNLKQMAAALQFLQEHDLTDYDALAARTEAAVEQTHALAGELQTVEDQLARTSELMGAVVEYAKTRPVFDGYKAAKYSKKYLAEHGDELDRYRAAKAAINDLLAGAKLPKMDVLKKRRQELAARKKELYTQYRAAQRDMRELVAVQGNIDHLLSVTGGRENKDQER